MSQAVDPQQFHPHSHSSALKTASGLNFLAGIYLIISAWIGSINGAERWNGIIAGIVVAVLAASRFAESTGPWASWLNALIGIWLIVSPWVYRYAGTGWMWNSIVVGIIMLVLGFWATTSADRDNPVAPPPSMPRY